MKNALVIEHHLGDSGNVTEGMILVDISDKRFNALEKKGLVREATPEEVKNGHQHAFVAEADRDDDDHVDPVLAARLEVIGEAERRFADMRDEHAKALQAQGDRVTHLEQQLDDARREAGELSTARAEAEKQLEEARSEIDKLRGDLANATEKLEKQQQAPANKKAVDPANKGA
jgi:chromosome segregation ATPase